MRGPHPKYYVKLLLIAALFVMGSAGTVMANTKSDSFQISEPEFGAGSALETCSGQYCAQATIGDMSSGAAASASETTASFGPIEKEAEPLLEVIIDEGESNLGRLTTESTASKTTIIKVRSYLSDGYTLQIIGDPPKYESHTLTTPDTPVAAQPGQEQFGINLVANTTPKVGADPKQIPSAEFSFGEIEPDYARPDLFKYESGDVVARSLTESGQTEYTVSMIVNVAGSTPAGHYAADFSAVVIPIF